MLQFLKSSQESFSLISQRRSPSRQQLSAPDKLEPTMTSGDSQRNQGKGLRCLADVNSCPRHPDWALTYPGPGTTLTPVPSRRSLPHWISQPQEWTAVAQIEPKRYTGCVKLIIWGEKREIHQTNLTLFLFFQIWFQPARVWQWLPGTPILWPTHSLRNGYHFTILLTAEPPSTDAQFLAQSKY